MPPKPDLSYIGLEEFTSESAAETLNAKTSKDVPKVVKNDNGALIIENWESNDEDESVPQPKIEEKIVKPSVGKYDTHALADIGSNINVLPYGIYEKIGKREAKPIEIKIKMLDHSKAVLIGILRDVLFQVGVTIILARFLILDIPADKDVPIVQKFPMDTVKNKQEEKDNDDKEEIIEERDENRKPFYNPRTVESNGAWRLKFHIMDPYGNEYNQGYQSKTIDRELSKFYKLSGIMSPDCIFGHVWTIVVNRIVPMVSLLLLLFRDEIEGVDWNGVEREEMVLTGMELREKRCKW
nr:hypothetical protein [Tanacetum cinerariifolium]